MLLYRVRWQGDSSGAAGEGEYNISMLVIIPSETTPVNRKIPDSGHDALSGMIIIIMKSVADSPPIHGGWRLGA